MNSEPTSVGTRSLNNLKNQVWILSHRGWFDCSYISFQCACHWCRSSTNVDDRVKEAVGYKSRCDISK